MRLRNLNYALIGCCCYVAGYVTSCEEKKEKLTADQIIAKTIESHGGALYDHMQVDFDFRDKHYTTKVKEGEYVAERTFSTEAGLVIDRFEDNTFKRTINEVEVELSSSSRRTFQNETNSVIYFALLPFHLDDPVINRQLMRSVTIKDQPYYKVEVTFGDGGGDEYESAYVYWIHKEQFTMDYFAYSFNINGGGVRFREVSKVQTVEGIRFQDYNNYTIAEDYPAHELDYAFEQGKLKLVSTIELKEVKVKLISD
jgi:hypothetical protein